MIIYFQLEIFEVTEQIPPPSFKGQNKIKYLVVVPICCLKPQDNIGKTEKLKCSQIYT